MIFCPSCDNTFNYQENIEERTLCYSCDQCNITQPLDSVCLVSKTFKQSTISDGNYQHAFYDKTLPISVDKTCNKCQQNNLCYIQKEDLQLVYICKTPNCKNIIK